MANFYTNNDNLVVMASIRVLPNAGAECPFEEGTNLTSRLPGVTQLLGASGFGRISSMTGPRCITFDFRTRRYLGAFEGASVSLAEASKGTVLYTRVDHATMGVSLTAVLNMTGLPVSHTWLLKNVTVENTWAFVGLATDESTNTAYVWASQSSAPSFFMSVNVSDFASVPVLLPVRPLSPPPLGWQTPTGMWGELTNGTHLFHVYFEATDVWSNVTVLRFDLASGAVRSIKIDSPYAVASQMTALTLVLSRVAGGPPLLLLLSSYSNNQLLSMYDTATGRLVSSRTIQPPNCTGSAAWLASMSVQALTAFWR